MAEEVKLEEQPKGDEPVSITFSFNILRIIMLIFFLLGFFIRGFFCN